MLGTTADMRPTARRMSGICGAIMWVSGFVGAHVALASNVGRVSGARAAFASMLVQCRRLCPRSTQRARRFSTRPAKC